MTNKEINRESGRIFENLLLPMQGFRLDEVYQLFSRVQPWNKEANRVV